MPTARRLTTTSIAALCLLTGCQPATTPTTTPTPTYTCTPEAGGPEYTCTPFQHDDMLAKDKLYTEAEAVYRKFLDEEVRVLRLGGTNAPTDVLLATTNGAFRSQVMEDWKHAKAAGIEVSRGSRTIESVTRLAGLSKGGSVVALAICVDSTSIRFTKDGKADGRGSITRDELYFGEFDSILKIIGADGKEVKKC